MRQAIERLLAAAGHATVAFESAEALLAADVAPGAACFVLDVRLPGISGFELHAQLRENGIERPVIFVTAHDEATSRDAATRAGAMAFLPKPFAGRSLLDAVTRALGGRAGG